MDNQQVLLHTLVLRGHHWHHPDPCRLLQRAGINGTPFLLGHIHHVQRDDDRRREQQQFGHQVQVALQLRRIRYHDHHVGLLLDDEIAGDEFLR